MDWVLKRADLSRSGPMRTASFIFAGIIMAGFCSPASAQIMMPQPNMPTGLDCGTPQNALEYYCNHRDQFSSSGAFLGAGQPVVATNPDVRTTGSIDRQQATRKVRQR
jgi:hypothetical protein